MPLSQAQSAAVLSAPSSSSAIWHMLLPAKCPSGAIRTSRLRLPSPRLSSMLRLPEPDSSPREHRGCAISGPRRTICDPRLPSERPQPIIAPLLVPVSRLRPVLPRTTSPNRDRNNPPNSANLTRYSTSNCQNASKARFVHPQSDRWIMQLTATYQDNTPCSRTEASLFV